MFRIILRGLELAELQPVCSSSEKEGFEIQPWGQEVRKVAGQSS